MAMFGSLQRFTWRTVPLVLAGMIAGAFLLSPAVGEAAAFLTKKKADKRYLGNNTVVTTTVTVPYNDGASITVLCPPGQQASGGGADSPLSGPAPSIIAINESKPTLAGVRTSGWNVEVVNGSSGGPVAVTAYAVCVP